YLHRHALPPFPPDALPIWGLIGCETLPGPVVVLAMDRDRRAESLALAAELRAAGIRAEAYLGESGIKAQMKYADRRGAPCVVIRSEEHTSELQSRERLVCR